MTVHFLALSCGHPHEAASAGVGDLLRCKFCNADATVVRIYGPATIPPTQLCEHQACRSARAAELADIADITGNPRYLREAIDVHDQLVRCRMTS